MKKKIKSITNEPTENAKPHSSKRGAWKFFESSLGDLRLGLLDWLLTRALETLTPKS